MLLGVVGNDRVGGTAWGSTDSVRSWQPQRRTVRRHGADDDTTDDSCADWTLSTSPFELDSFQRDLDEKPDLLIADAGSADMGPYPLGADRSASNEAFQYHDLEHMLLAARRLAIPMIVGSASDAGTDRGVASFVQMIRNIASEHHLAPLSLATISAELFAVPVERVTDFVVFEPANAIKFTVLRLQPSGSQGETDIYGCQQYARLFDVEIP